ncbi:DUF998 domain-containing protein [Chloroflexota bacterium]
MGLLVISFLALLLAPSLMPAGYSWVRHTTSESAAQGIQGAWLARLGFLVFGWTVVWISVRLQERWPLSVRLMHATFGLLMTATAAFSTRPWFPDMTYDRIEDTLHSFAATSMGFAFAMGVLMRFLHRGQDLAGRVMDLIAIGAAVAIPLAMSAFPEWDGLLQRGMFATAYIWYGFELLRQGCY